MNNYSKFQDWYWGGGPARRAGFGLAVTILLTLVFLPFGQDGARLMLTMGLGWDIGAYAMDKAHLSRLSRERSRAG